ncbi:MAG: ferritin-like domain-containing protein [Acidimicrobiia bacterium]
MSDDLNFLSASARLGAVEQLDVPSMELLYRLECSGEDFYNTLADRIGNDDAADLLRRNGREELGHANRIKRAIAIKVGADYEPSGSTLEKLPIALPETISVDLLPLVVQGELDGNAGYQKWADNEPDADVARLLRLNGREEVKHGERVTEAIALMKAGAADGDQRGHGGRLGI